MNSPTVLRALAFKAHGSCVASKVLLERAKRGLDYALSRENYAPRDGSKPTVRPADMIRAAWIVCDTLTRNAPEIIKADMDGEGVEPEDLSLEEAARLLLDRVRAGG